MRYRRRLPTSHDAGCAVYQRHMLVTPAYAKVNLALEVVRSRADGWHDIDSIVVPVDWHDLVGLRAGSSHATLRVTGAATGIPGAGDATSADSNIAFRAASLVSSMLNEATRRVFDIWLDKRIPAGAGLGGGSADAAAILRTAAALLHQRHDIAESDLVRMATTLGSDVPAQLAQRPVRVRGRGELLTPIAAPTLHLVVAFLAATSTAAVYQACTPAECTGGDRTQGLQTALERGDLPDDELLGSALEPAALRVNAELRAKVAELRAAAPTERWHMTGSGGAFFALAGNAAECEDIAERLRASGFEARACRSRAGYA